MHQTDLEDLFHHEMMGIYNRAALLGHRPIATGYEPSTAQS